MAAGRAGNDPNLLEISNLESRYQIAEELGNGAMGEVFEAEDTRLTRTAALSSISLPPTSCEGR